ncbi:MAG: sporulation protein YabP [Clostridia bacterium]|nr:sporulation protein YabP [Clostridia bacterium]MBR3838310.1 sporulation protein YabP [Clostridia bacterium]
MPDTATQDVFIKNRENIKITGVLDVRSFDDVFVDLDTDKGRMLIRGEGLKIGSLSLEQHELYIVGYIYGCEYEDIPKNKKSMLSRIFR